VSADAKNKLLADITAVEKSLAELTAAKRMHASRANTFLDFFETTKGDLPEHSTVQIKAMISSAQDAEKKTDMAIVDAKNRYIALNELTGIFTTVPPPRPKINVVMPIRRPDVENAHRDLREGTDIYKVRELLRKAKKPLPLLEMVTELFGADAVDVRSGKYANLRGTLCGYAKENRIFTIESKLPYIIGLIEFNELSGGFKTRVA